MAINFLGVNRKVNLAFLAVLFAQVQRTAQGQREKKGCYDLAPLSCDNGFAQEDPSALAEIGMDYVKVESVCRRLQKEVLPGGEVYMDTSLHQDHLNSVPATDEFCSEIQASYKYCSFCQGTQYLLECKTGAGQVKCVGKPSRQEVLADTTTYALFESDEDIYSTCDALEEFYKPNNDQKPSTPKKGKPNFPPLSMFLCERQRLVKHLCPGQCEGGCFTEENAPSCDSPSLTRKGRPETGATGDPPGDVVTHHCKVILNAVFHGSIEVAMNVSSHLGYLQSISEDSTLCQRASEFYSSCFWCNYDEDNMCFNSESPASCEEHSDFLGDEEEFSFQEIEEACRDIKTSFLPGTKIIGIRKNTTRCETVRKAYPKCKWCFSGDDPEGVFCSQKGSLCSPGGYVFPVPDDFVSPTLSKFGIVGTISEQNCDELSDFKFLDAQSLAGCYDNIFLSGLCPDAVCAEFEAKGISKDYLGATTTAQKRAIIWLARVSAFLSFMGASFILYDTLTDAKARRTVYHQLLIGMAIFDIVTAFAWCFATAPIDATNAGLDHVEGAIGTEATCKAQAFFIQLGFTSVFYNVSLALYYALVIGFGWREFQLMKIRPLLHGIPLVVGFGLAFGGIPIYGFIEYGCHVTPGGELWVVLVFVVLPLGFSIAAITASALMVYCKVSQQVGSSRKWSLGVGKAGKLEQAVFWQCFFYVLAFYITWPIMFAVYLASIDEDGPLGLALIVAFVAPLQGFSNFLVYIRPLLTRKKIWISSGVSSTSMAGMMRRVFRSRNGDTEPSGISRVDPSVAVALSSHNNDGENGEASENSYGIAPESHRAEEYVKKRRGTVRMKDPSVALAYSIRGPRTNRHSLTASSRAPLPMFKLADGSSMATGNEDLRMNGESDHSTGNDRVQNDASFAVDETESPDSAHLPQSVDDTAINNASSAVSQSEEPLEADNKLDEASIQTENTAEANTGLDKSAIVEC